MRICAVLSEGSGCDELKMADIAEIDLDIFDRIPYVNKEMIIKVGDPSNASRIPNDLNGYVDIGSLDISVDHRTITSHHDHKGTPNEEVITKILQGMKGDIVKGAFRVNDVNDLMSIFQASRIKRPHVLIGMGELGIITRIRQTLLNNEFTYAHTGIPNASGQLSVSEMSEIGDDCMLTGLLGHPLTQVSKIMHDAAFRAAGMNGRYLILDSPRSEGIGEVIRSYGMRGVNVTTPFKSKIMEQLDSLDTVAEEAGAVNTIVCDDGELTGYNTDVLGIEGAFRRADVELKGKRTLIIGSGGAARACAYYLSKNNVETHMTARNTSAAADISREFGCILVDKDSIPLKMFDIVINCTPIRNHKPIPLEHLDHSHIVFDLVHHTETVLIRKAMSIGCKIVSGKDMLVTQGAESFRLWTGVDPWEAMRDAIG